VIDQQDISSQSSDIGDTLVNTVKNARNASKESLLGGDYTMVILTDDQNHQEKAKQNDISVLPFSEVIRAEQPVSMNL
jgi:hypothetical protein